MPFLCTDICFFFSFAARQGYFTHFELTQSLGGAKTGDLWEKPPDHQQAELGLSHMWPERGSNPQQWNDKQFRALKINCLNHFATGAAHRHVFNYWMITIYM